MRARDRFQFVSTSAAVCPMQRQMLETWVAPKTIRTRRRTASKISRTVPLTMEGSTMRIVVITSTRFGIESTRRGGTTVA
jgi:hypothetical protein